MSEFVNEAAYNDAYCSRVRECRTALGWTQEQMADALGVPADRYRKYEVRSPLPQYLIERFALLTHRDVHYIVTGKQLHLARKVERPRFRRAG